MAENVVKFTPAEVGGDYRFDADETLEKAKGQDFERMMVIGELADGDLYLMGNANAGETLILMEKIRHYLVFGGE